MPRAVRRGRHFRKKNNNFFFVLFFAAGQLFEYLSAAGKEQEGPLRSYTAGCLSESCRAATSVTPVRS